MMAELGIHDNLSKMVDEQLLKTEVAVMTGGRDQFGRPLVVFPASNFPKMAQQYTAAHMVLLLQYYITIGQTQAQHRGFAFIANFLSCPKECIRIVVETLDKLQSEVRGSVAILYAIPPKSKDLLRTFKKLVGLKPSKKHPKVATYETILLENTTDLQRYVSTSQLTPDLGGTMTFNHQKWVHFQQDIAHVEVLVQSALDRLPEAQDKVAMLSEYDIPDDASENSDLLLQIRTKYNDIMRELNLEHLIDQCKELHEQMAAPSKHPRVKDIAMVMTFTLSESKIKMEEYRNQLVKAREKLKLLWQHAEGRIVVTSKVKKYKAKAEKVGEWMQTVGLPTVNQDPEIADCLSKAEIFKNHFETGFLAIAQNVLWLSEKILKKLNGVIMEVSSSSKVQGGNLAHIEPVLKYTKQFQATVEYFKCAVNKKHQVYLNVHSFFLTSARMTKWYRRTLRFLPVQLLEPNARFQSNRLTSAAPYVSDAWRAAVDDFVLHHPLPATPHLTKMKNVIPVIDNVGVRNQARLLISRVSLLRRLLASPEQVTPMELKDVLHWKDQVTEGHDDICLNLTTSTLDLSQLQDQKAYHPNTGHLSARQSPANENEKDWFEVDHTRSIQMNVKRTPKLKSVGATENIDEYAQSTGQHLGSGSRSQTELNSRGQDYMLAPSYSHENLWYSLGGPDVPRLELMNRSPNDYTRSRSPMVQKVPKDCQKVLAVKRQESFGVYGHGDEPSRPRMMAARREAKSSHDAGHACSAKVQRSLTEDERYVTLGGTDTPRSSELPTTLKHIDIGALKNNLPQKYPVDQMSGIHGNRDHGTRLNSYESLADSGIANTQSSPEGSGMSVSTNELSPSFSIGHGRMDAVMEGEEPTQATIHDSSRQDQLLDAESRLNLDFSHRGFLSLSQTNINTIVNSALTAEEKLGLMAAMCEADPETDSQRIISVPPDIQHRFIESEFQNISIIPDKDRQDEPGRNKTPNLEMLGHLPDITSMTNVRNSVLMAGRTHDQQVTSDESMKTTPPGNPQAVINNRTPKLVGGKCTSQEGLPTVQHLLRFPQHVENPVSLISQPIAANPRNPVPSTRRDNPTLPKANPATKVITATGDTKREELRYGNCSGYGIDIEAWMRTQEESREAVDESSLNGEDGMSEYIEKWKNAKDNRATEERELERARETLEGLLVEEEERAQDEVERTLLRTERMLQEQENLLQATQEGGAIEERAESPKATEHSPRSLTTGDTKGHDACESSLSGESGVFTQASSASSRLQTTDSLSSNSTAYQLTSNGLSSRGSKTINQNDISQIRSQLNQTSCNRKQGTKPFSVRQVDFRDRLTGRSVTSEEEPAPNPSMDIKLSIKYDLHPNAFSNKLVSLEENSETLAENLSQKNGYIPEGNINKSFQPVPEDIVSPLVGTKEPPPKEKTITPLILDENCDTDVAFSSGESTPVNNPRTDPVTEPNSNGKASKSATNRSDITNNNAVIRTDTSILSAPPPRDSDPFHTQCNQTSTENIDLYNKNSCTPFLSTVLKDQLQCGRVAGGGVNGLVKISSLRDDAEIRIEDNMTSDAKVMELGSRPERSEVKGHADMKFKVEAGGGSARTNAKSLPSHSMEFASLKTPIIIDNGSGMCKCGFADQDLPSAIFPALVGRAKYEDVTVGPRQQNYVGSAAQSMRGVLKLQYPLEHGVITDWKDMELIWEHAFSDQLRVNPEDHPVLITEAPLNPHKNRERMMQLLFETFQVPAMYVAVQAVLALYSTGRTTGVVLDSGDGVSHIVPIYEGYSLPHAINRLDLAGRDLTEYLVKLMYEQGMAFTTTAEQEIVKDIKEQMCYVAIDYREELSNAANNGKLQQLYTLPDGRSLTIATERFRCPEALFQPALIGREHGGLQDSIFTSVMKCDIDLRPELMSNILLSGGTTTLPGFSERLQQDVAALAPPGLSGRVHVVCPEERYFSVWRGGAVLASLPTFTDSWITYDEYLEFGDNIVHSKCF